ncbi:Lrp/AsnC family transcriptional regulator [Pseudomonas solani]|uniref:Lrp/AsnC family transcriptional regulator n=1 Tax=Pseudomonas solani TaxID=2731552 RepID=UPI003C2FBB57
MTLDDYDHRLLAEIQRDATLPQSELGERVNLSAAAVNRRLKRYREEGIVRGQVALVEPERLGHPLTLVVQVEVESERIDLLDAMKRSFARCPQVQQCYYTAGEWDFVLILAVRNMEQYTELTRSLFFESNNVRRFKTLVSMSNVKVGLEIPTGFDAPQGAARS